MASFPNIVLVVWLGLAPLLFLTRLPRHVVVAALVVFGLLFLPEVSDSMPVDEGQTVAALAIPGLTLTKYKVVSLAVLLGLVLSNPAELAGIRLSWVDLPMIAWCIWPFLSASTAPPPPDDIAWWKDGLYQTISQSLHWGVPYFAGKRYFSNYAALRDLVGVYLVGAALYLPLCLFEVRMSPQLHFHVYGFMQHSFLQAVRFGGFRPMVFMHHGLAVSFFMVAATLIAFWLWWTAAARWLPARVLQKHPALFPLFLAALFVTAALSKSTGALALGMAGAGVLFVSARLKTRWPVIGLLIVPFVYISVRTTDAWSGADLVPLLEQVVGPDRAESFAFRQHNEDLLIEKAFEGPALGWGGWGRNYVCDRRGKPITVPDGLWIIALGQYGMGGLLDLYVAMLLPVVRFLWLQPPAAWSRPWCACAAAGAMIVALHMLDNLLNGMHNPVFILMAGALAGLPRVAVPASATAQALLPRPRMPRPFVPRAAAGR
jgi:hypothetical protein